MYNLLRIVRKGTNPREVDDSVNTLKDMFEAYLKSVCLYFMVTYNGRIGSEDLYDEALALFYDGLLEYRMPQNGQDYIYFTTYITQKVFLGIQNIFNLLLRDDKRALVMYVCTECRGRDDYYIKYRIKCQRCNRNYNVSRSELENQKGYWCKRCNKKIRGVRGKRVLYKKYVIYWKKKVCNYCHKATIQESYPVRRGKERVVNKASCYADERNCLCTDDSMMNSVVVKDILAFVRDNPDFDHRAEKILFFCVAHGHSYSDLVDELGVGKKMLSVIKLRTIKKLRAKFKRDGCMG